jgi:hypothetical protein
LLEAVLVVMLLSVVGHQVAAVRVDYLLDTLALRLVHRILLP